MSAKKPVFGSKLPLEMMADLLYAIRTTFYVGQDPEFYSQRKVLMKAVTYPAAYLESRNGLPTPARYEEIFRQEIIAPIKQHSNYQPGPRSYFCRYFYTCVQRHMVKHWETYYEESKRVQRQVADVMHGLSKLQIQQPAPGSPQTRMTILSEVHDAISIKGGRKKKPVPGPVADDQGSLF